jgi:hypothetical protein
MGARQGEGVRRRSADRRRRHARSREPPAQGRAERCCVQQSASSAHGLFKNPSCAWRCSVQRRAGRSQVTTAAASGGEEEATSSTPDDDGSQQAEGGGLPVGPDDRRDTHSRWRRSRSGAFFLQMRACTLSSAGIVCQLRRRANGERQQSMYILVVGRSPH